MLEKMYTEYRIPANHPNFIGAVSNFDFQNFQKSGHPGFLDLFQSSGKYSCFSIFQIITHVVFSRPFLFKLRRNFLYRSEPCT